MFNLTQLEQQAIIFVVCSLLVGGGVTLIRWYGLYTTVAEVQTEQALELSVRGGNSSLPDQPNFPAENTRQASVLNINTASAKQLRTLPGIGPILAQRVISYREQMGMFQSPDQLLDVKGIGPVVFSGIKPLITVPEPSPKGP